jgi:glycosyltransferase involved in cell wall biosynthesis
VSRLDSALSNISVSRMCLMTRTGGISNTITRATAHVLDIELTKPVAELQRTAPDGRRADQAWVLVRLLGEPLGLDILDIPPDGLSSEAVEALVLDPRLRRLARLLGIDEMTTDRDIILSATRTTDSTAFSRAHAGFIGRVPRCSVVVCTRERPDGLRRCLGSLTGQDHPSFAVWVIDNAPTSTDTREIVKSFDAALDIHYVIEPRPGLSRARNAGLRSGLGGDFVAWLDDDEVADSLWLSELIRAFDGRPEVVAASGAVVPAELATQPQLWFEQFGGHSKGRGFTPDEFSPHTRHRQHPLYPLPPFGVGANMAFRTEALRRLGGFDEALGAGRPAQGSEDTKVFTDLLRAGGTVAYHPSALTRHFHRRDLDGLRRQMRGYGSGLTAFYTASVLARPSTIVDLIRLAPRALRDLRSSDGLRLATLGDDFPRDLLADNRRGLIAGPWLYLRGRLQDKRGDRRNWLP